MLTRKVVLTLLIGLLSVTGLSASDKDCSSCAPKKKTQDCACAPNKQAPDCACAPEKRTPDCTCAPQKTQDSCVPQKTQDCCPPQVCCPPQGCCAAPTGCIAPRDLPLVYESQARLAADAAQVLADFPQQGWLENARAIAVIPRVKKGAFGVGFRWGTGLISMRDENGCWIPPSYIHIHGGNIGFQAGVQSTDLVLIFTNTGAVRSLLRGKMTLNADASAAAFKWGRKGLVGIPLLVNSGIYTFSRSRWAFAGVSLDGAAITIADTNNQAVYGRNVSGTDILRDRRVEPNDVVAPFLNALVTIAPGRPLTAQQDTTPTEAETVAGTQQ